MNSRSLAEPVFVNIFRPVRRLMRQGRAKIANGGSIFGRFLIADVPPEIARCEFDCREPRCSGERWRNYEKRKSYAECEKQR